MLFCIFWLSSTITHTCGKNQFTTILCKMYTSWKITGSQFFLYVSLHSLFFCGSFGVFFLQFFKFVSSYHHHHHHLYIIIVFFVFFFVEVVIVENRKCPVSLFVRESWREDTFLVKTLITFLCENDTVPLFFHPLNQVPHIILFCCCFAFFSFFSFFFFFFFFFQTNRMIIMREREREKRQKRDSN